MMQPKGRKYRKDQKGKSGKILGVARKPYVVNGDFGLQAITASRLTARQIESARRTITRTFKRQGKLWIRAFPSKPISKKPLEVRQGKGKGSVELYVYLAKPGSIIFEASGIAEDLCKEAFKLAGAKLPFKVKMVKREVSTHAEHA